MVSVNRNPKATDGQRCSIRQIARRVRSIIVGQAVHSQAPTRTAEKIATDPAPRPIVPGDQVGYTAIEVTDPANPTSERHPATANQRKLSPMAAEMQQAIRMERDGLRRLHARFQQTSDPHAALAIQREIEALKVGTELELLRIQANHARREGRVEAAKRIETVIEQILNPVVPKAPADMSRPRPGHDAPQEQGKE
jgi:hypothetical protein